MANWYLLIAYMLGVFILSVIPSAVILTQLTWEDKLYHASAYFFMGILSFRTINSQTSYVGRAVFLLAFMMSFLYGVFMEIIQGYVPGRTRSFFDAIANGVGAFSGIYLYTICEGRIKKFLKYF